MFPQLFGKYVLEGEIAGGGMARVYLATLRGAVGFEKRLVVKQIRPELASDDAFVKRFVEEAKTAVELTHPNIVPVYELGVEQGTYFIAMELCEGVTLSELLAETGLLTPEEGAYVGIEICRALDYAHRRAGIVHRDVTPRNVMIDEEGAVRLIDFGIAAPADEGRSEVFGSPGHMPPEQLAGRTLTPATDVFAVAALLVEAWTGKPPFRRATAAECKKALDDEVPSIADHDAALGPIAGLVARAVALDPKQRPSDAEALARPLRDFVKLMDLGDLARLLGERVRQARARGGASEPWRPGDGLTGDSRGADPSTPREVTPQHVTRTFAARGDIVEWTRKIPSEIPPPLESEQEPTSTPVSPDVTPKAAPQVVDRSRDQPIERDSQPPDSTEHAPLTTSSGATRSSGSWRVGLAALGLVVGVVAVVSLGRRDDVAPVSTMPVSITPVAVSQGPNQPTHTALEPSSTPPAPPSGPTPQPHTSASPPVSAAAMGTQPAPSAGPDAAAKQATATLVVSTIPSQGVSVSIDGQARAPGSFGLSAGSHSVVFRFAETGESVPASVALAPGQTKTVTADFAAAVPTVRISK